MVKSDGVICLATVIDAAEGNTKPKRVRLQSGEHAGEVRMPAQYELLEFVNCH